MAEGYVSNFVVEPQTLTDKSIVFDVVAKNDVSSVRINCSDEVAAQRLCGMLNSVHVVGFVVDSRAKFN